MDENKLRDNNPIVYQSEEVEIDKQPITYTGKINSGGARESTVIGPVKAYPLTSDEYYIIKDKIPKGDFNNKQSFMLSSGLSFFCSSILYGLTTDFTSVVNQVTEIKWLHVIFLIIFISISLGSLLSFVLTYKNIKKNKTKTPFEIVENRIKNILEINE